MTADLSQRLPRSGRGGTAEAKQEEVRRMLVPVPYSTTFSGVALRGPQRWKEWQSGSRWQSWFACPLFGAPKHLLRQLTWSQVVGYWAMLEPCYCSCSILWGEKYGRGRLVSPWKKLGCACGFLLWVFLFCLWAAPSSCIPAQTPFVCCPQSGSRQQQPRCSLSNSEPCQQTLAHMKVCWGMGLCKYHSFPPSHSCKYF